MNRQVTDQMLVSRRDASPAPAVNGAARRHLTVGHPGRRTRRSFALGMAASAWCAAVALSAAHLAQAQPSSIVPTPTPESGAAPLLSQTAVISSTVSPPTTLPDATRGLAIYRDHCASCHGSFGRGDGEMADRLPSPPTNFAAEASAGRLSPQEAFQIVTDGRLANGMPPWRDALSATERWDSLAGAWSYYYTPERLARGRAAWEAQCASCHAAGGSKAPSPQALASWDTLARLSQDALVRGIKSSPLGSASHASLLQVDETELRRAADYLRGLSYRPLSYEHLAPGGAIRGAVTNGTTNRSDWADPSAVVVRIVPFATDGFVPGLTITPTVGGDGRFAADDLLAGEDLSYHLIASYKDVDYIFPDAVRLDAASPRADAINLEVFEPSTQASITVKSLEVIVAPEPVGGWVSVAEVWQLENDSKTSKVSAGPDQPTLRLPLAPGATEVSLEDARPAAAATVLSDEVRFFDPFPPGAREVALTYALTVTGPTMALDRVLPSGAGEVNLRLVGDGLRLVGDGLTATESTTVTHESMTLPVHSWRVAAIAPGERLNVTLAGLPSPPAITVAWASPSLLAGCGAALALAGILGALVYPAWSRRPRDAGYRSARARLVAKIAALDGAYEAGHLDRAAYGERRARLVAAALALTRPAAAPDSPETPGQPASERGAAAQSGLAEENS